MPSASNCAVAAATETSTEGDTTESEGEEARPVTVRFARRDTGVSRYVLRGLAVIITLSPSGVSVCQGVTTLADSQWKKAGCMQV